MGDRISISFKDSNENSIVFCDHWGGRHLINDVNEFIKTMDLKYPRTHSTPQTRREPSWMMPLFVAFYYRKYPNGEEVYLVQDEGQCDNSDRGHFTYDFDKNQWDRELESE
jgi:hypothetical protein